MSTLELTVDGMHCGGCSKRLKRALEESEGVSSAEVVLETKQVTVAFDAGQTNGARIRKVIGDSGFTVL